MPRRARLDAAGVLHQVMARGIEQGLIFRDDRDREDFIGRLSDLATRQSWIIYAWALMSNHFHLLVRTGKAPLSRNMRVLMSGYAGYFNRRHKRSGHVFQNRYKSIICEEETYFLELVRYLHLNPIRAKKVKDLSGLDSYKYCGRSAIVGTINQKWQDTDEVLGRFSGKREMARRRYREFVEAGVGQGRRTDLVGGGLLRSYGGWKGVMDLKRGREKYRSDERVLGSTAFMEEIVKEVEKKEEEKNRSVSLDTLIGRISGAMGISRKALTGGGRNRAVTRARAVLAYTWVRYLGRSGHELANELGVTPQALYASSNRVETGDVIHSRDLARWCK
jgi:REP-associated tyrosine transposase